MITNHQRVSRRRPCPVCSKTDYCYFSEDNNFVFCMRVSNGAVKQARNGAYIHRFGEQSFQQAEQPVRATPKKEKPQNAKAKAEHLHAVYSEMLSLLLLENSHRDDLTKRGLSHTAIVEGGYKSTPSLFEAAQITFELSQKFNLKGVPGFFQDCGAWRMVNVREGFFVPYRNTHGQIHGLQIRLDQPIEGKSKYLWLSSGHYYLGTSSSSPVHFVRPELINKSSEVLITEGALKGNIISYYTSMPTVAAAGVYNFSKNFAANLRKRFPALRKTILCFDTDLYDNEQVLSALFRLGEGLQQAFFDVSVREWDNYYKGYDDFLNAQANNNFHQTKVA